MLVSPLQEELEQVPEQLKRDILEREGGTVKELENVSSVRELLQRGDL